MNPQTNESKVQKFLRSELSFYVAIIIPTFLFAGIWFSNRMDVQSIRSDNELIKQSVNTIETNHLAHLQTYYEEMKISLEKHITDEDKDKSTLMQALARIDVTLAKLEQKVMDKVQ